MNGTKLQPLVTFNAEVVQKPLNGLLINVNREIERTLKQAIASRDRTKERHFSLLLMMIRLAINSYESACYLLVPAQNDPKVLMRRATAIVPINRQIMDSLFSLIYMLDDFPARSLEYEISGYRQLREMQDRFVARFSNDCAMQEYLGRLEYVRGLAEHYLPITPEQKADPHTTIRRWPPPSRLIKKKTASRMFLEFLHAWLYDDTSAQAHLNAGGLAQVGAFTLNSLAPDDMQRLMEERSIRQYTFLHFTRTLTVVLALATEVDSFQQFQNREAIQRLWVLMSGWAQEARDVYQRRYEAMLA